MKTLKIRIYKSREVAVIQETEHYVLVTYLPDLENGFFSVKHEELSGAPYLELKTK